MPGCIARRSGVSRYDMSHLDGMQANVHIV